MKKVILLLSFALFGFTQAVLACDDSTMDITNVTDNMDGTFTYDFDLFVELGAFDAGYYGFDLTFSSLEGTSLPTTYPATIGTGDLTTGSFGSSVLNASVSGGQLTYEYGGVFPITSNDFTLSLQVTTTGCAEHISFFSHNNTASVAVCTHNEGIINVTAGTQSVCSIVDNTYTQEITVTYDLPTGAGAGTIDVNGQSFIISGSPQTITLVGLTADGSDVDVTTSLSNLSNTCPVQTTGLFTAPASCAVLPCSIDDVTLGTQSACNPANNTYSQEVVVTYSNPPSSGTLNVNGTTFTITTSPQTVILTGLTSDGTTVNGTVVFSADAACTDVVSFTAPASCLPCSIDNVVLGTQTACAPATNTYTQEVVVTYSNEPSSGTLDVNGQSFAIGTSPQTVTLVGLTANGATVNGTVVFSADANCNDAVSFIAPASCAVIPCSIDNVTLGTQSACNPSDDTYTQEVTVTYSNAPSSGTLDVNGQSFAISTSPQTVTLTALTADGSLVNATIEFSDDTACNDSVSFTAPAACSVSCNPDNGTWD